MRKNICYILGILLLASQVMTAAPAKKNSKNSKSSKSSAKEWKGATRNLHHVAFWGGGGYSGLMNNYDNMLLANKKLSEEKKILAIDTIRRMVKANEHISIVELTKLTGLSRSFFYKNEQVNDELMKALKSQEGKILSSRRDKTLNEALKETVKMQKDEIDRLRREKSQLTFALKRLQDEKQNDVDFALIEKL